MNENMGFRGVFCRGGARNRPTFVHRTRWNRAPLFGTIAARQALSIDNGKRFGVMEGKEKGWQAPHEDETKQEAPHGNA